MRSPTVRKEPWDAADVTLLVGFLLRGFVAFSMFQALRDPAVRWGPLKTLGWGMDIALGLSTVLGFLAFDFARSRKDTKAFWFGFIGGLLPPEPVLLVGACLSRWLRNHAAPSSHPP